MTEATTALVCSDAYLRHDPGPNAEEVPGRITAIVNAIKGAGIQNALLHLTPTPASIEAVLRVHDRSHVGAVREACARAPAKLDRDTYVSKDSYEVALLAAGGVLNAAEAVMRGEAHNAFCVVRPPGHHATPTRAMGFCLFNNVAIAARHLQQAHGIARVLIVDWDAHHGNGTQEVFYDDPGVLYFSTHQFPCYPGTGGADERGTGAGIGFTINVPMPAGSGDAEYLAAFNKVLVPAADAFKPEFVLISAGFDPHLDDPLTGLAVSTAGFARLTAIVMEIAARHCGGRLVSALEGGYHLENLAASAVAHVKTLMEK